MGAAWVRAGHGSGNGVYVSGGEDGDSNAPQAAAALPLVWGGIRGQPCPVLMLPRGAVVLHAHRAVLCCAADYDLATSFYEYGALQGQRACVLGSATAAAYWGVATAAAAGLGRSYGPARGVGGRPGGLSARPPDLELSTGAVAYPT